MANVLFNHFTKEAGFLSSFFNKAKKLKTFKQPAFAPDLELSSFVHDGVDLSPAAQKTIHALQDTNPHGMPSNLAVRNDMRGWRVLGESDQAIENRLQKSWEELVKRINQR